MVLREPITRWLALAPLAGTYFVAGKLGLRLAFAHPSTSPVWAPTGIALAAFLLLGYRVWPAIFLGAFLVNVTTAGTWATSLGVAAGNTLEGLLGAYLVDRFAGGGRRAFNQARDVFRFVLYAGLFSTTASATLGVTSLSLGGFAEWSRYGSIWLTWWLGDAVGAVVVAPLIILWAANPRLRWSAGRFLEAGILLGGLVLVGQAVFGGLSYAGNPLAFLSIPFVVWACFRLGRRVAALAIALLSAIAIRGTLAGSGAFAGETSNDSLLVLQAFIGVVAVMTLALGAEVAERRRLAEQLRELAITDSLTGLANHRSFLERLEEEGQRSERTRRPFAILLLDIDGLKKINDSLGHVAGNRALCRLASALRGQCRSIDLAARLGGDEFAVVLAETDEAGARQVARRILEALMADGEEPAISASVGVATYRGRGEAAEALLRAADERLYEMKSRGGGRRTGADPKPAPRR